MGLLSKINHTKGVKALTTSTPTWEIVGKNWLMPSENSKTFIDGYKVLPNVYGIISLITQKSALPPHQVMKIKNKTKFKEYKARLKALRYPTGDKNAKSNFNAQLRKLYSAKEQAFEEVDNSELDQLFDKPNNKMAIEELYEHHDGYLLLTGNSYFYGVAPGIGKNGSKPKELHVVPSPMVDPIADNLNITKYKVSYYNEPLDAEVVGHSKYFNPISNADSPVDQLKGMSPLLSCRNLLKRYEAADIAQGAMFTNMGPAGIISGENGELTAEQAQQVQDKFVQNHTGVQKAGKYVVTPARLHWTQIGVSTTDLGTIEGKKEMLGELCNVYHVPIGLFSDENSTDNNMDNSRKMFITDAVIPVCEKRKQTLNNWLAPKYGPEYYIDYDYGIFPEMQEDLKEQAETAAIMYWTTLNQKRELTGYDIDPNPLMDRYYIPSGIIPLEETNLEPEDIDEEELNDNNVKE